MTAWRNKITPSTIKMILVQLLSRLLFLLLLLHQLLIAALVSSSSFVEVQGFTFTATAVISTLSTKTIRRRTTSSRTSEVLFASTSTPAIMPLDDVEDDGRRITISHLSATDLRRIVTTTTAEDISSQSSSLDLDGLVWLEHINLVVGVGQLGKQQAQHFYIELLGCSPDKSKSFHVNLGQQQFHLKEATSSMIDPSSDDGIGKKDSETYPQTICGSIGIVVPDLQALYSRLVTDLDDPQSILQGTQFQIIDHDKVGTDNVAADSSVRGETLTVRCPWGNIFHCYQVDDRGTDTVPSSAVESLLSSPQKMTMMHSPNGGQYGPDRMAVRTKPGIRFVEIVVPPSSSNDNPVDGIEEFYRQVLKCKTRRRYAVPSCSSSSSSSSSDQLVVSVGPGVDLVFVPYHPKRDIKASSLTNKSDGISSQNDKLQSAIRKMRGVHICVYTQDFEGLYRRLSSLGLIWTNPRFVHLDSCETWKEAFMSRTLRFRYIVDPTTVSFNTDPLLELEHETRPLRHGQFMKVPFYEPR